MDAGLALYLIDHGRYIPRGRQNIHRQGQGSHAVDRNGLMDRQDIALIIRDGLQYQGQQSRLVVHLQYKGDAFSLGIVMEDAWPLPPSEVPRGLPSV